MFKPYIEIELLSGEVITSKVWVSHQNFLLVPKELEERREQVFYPWHQIKRACIVTPPKPKAEVGARKKLTSEQADALEAILTPVTKKDS